MDDGPMWMDYQTIEADCQATKGRRKPSASGTLGNGPSKTNNKKLGNGLDILEGCQQHHCERLCVGRLAS